MKIIDTDIADDIALYHIKGNDDKVQ